MGSCADPNFDMQGNSMCRTYNLGHLQNADPRYQVCLDILVRIMEPKWDATSADHSPCSIMTCRKKSGQPCYPSIRSSSPFSPCSTASRGLRSKSSSTFLTGVIAEPNNASPLNPDAADLWNDEKRFKVHSSLPLQHDQIKFTDNESDDCSLARRRS